MEIKNDIRISPRVLNDNGTVSHTENIYKVIDKLIRLTAKLTEDWASDIIYDIENLNNAVANREKHDRLLFFRENGVTTWQTSEMDAHAYDTLLFNWNPIQIWRLTHDPSTMETKLIRVNIFKY
jgi:hypothetical protein